VAEGNIDGFADIGIGIERGEHWVLFAVPAGPHVVGGVASIVHPKFVVDFVVDFEIVHSGNEGVPTISDGDGVMLER